MTSETQTAEKYLFVHEGQSIPIEPEIAHDQDLLKRLLSTWAPAARTGELEYSDPDAYGLVTITLRTHAQPKGIQVTAADPVTALLAAESGENPVIVLYRELNALYEGAVEPAEILVLQAEIEQEIAQGKEERERLKRICAALIKASPSAGMSVTRQPKR